MGAFLFARNGDRIEPTGWSHAPWSADTLDGGATAAVLCQQAESLRSDEDLQLARLTVDLLAPVPAAPMTIAAQSVREGRRIQVVDAQLLDATGVVVARSSSLFLRRASTPPFIVHATEPVAPPAPAGLKTMPFPMPRPTLMGAQEGRPFRIPTLEEPGGGWVRTPLDLYEGIPLSAAARAAAAADRVNAMGSFVLTSNVGAINADITLHFARPPLGEWVAVDVFHRGRGEAQGMLGAHLHDEGGAFGTVLMSVMPPRVDGDFKEAMEAAAAELGTSADPTA